MRHPLDPKVDCVFKALLGAESNRDLLIHFLNAILGADLPPHAFRLRDQRGRIFLDHGGIWLLELSKFAAEAVETERSSSGGLSFSARRSAWTRTPCPRGCRPKR